MTVIVDSREPWERFFEHFAELGVDHQLEALTGPDHPKADFLVADRSLGVQRKTVNDFVSSIDSLKDDLFELRQHHEYSMLLVEGNWRIAGDRIALRRGSSLKQTIPIKGWHNFMVSQQLRGTMVTHTTTSEETARALVSWDRYFSEERSPPVSNNPDDAAVLLQLIPGVGPKSSQRIVAEYGSVYKALVHIDSWGDRVDGIGEKTESQIIEWFKNE